MTDWVELGTDTLRSARKRRGFSYERMGPEFNVVAKTWERWEKAGRVPRPLLPRVAEVLDLEIDVPPKHHVSVSQRPDAEAALQAVGEIRAAFARLERLLRELLDQPLDDVEEV